MVFPILGRVKDKFKSAQESRGLVLVIVFVALFLDNMLLTTVVPIIPNFLYKLDHPFANYPSNQTNRVQGSARPCIERKSPGERNSPGNSDSPVISDSPDNSDSPGNSDSLGETDSPGNGHHLSHGSSTTLPPCVDEPEFRIVNKTTSREERHRDVLNENVAVGLMFASKAIMQLITNPFVGPITNRIGYSIPMFTGFVIMFISTIIFAFAADYSVLFVARAVQGIGSACSSVSGMGMLADRYTDDRERGNAMGIALGGLALGVLVGPPFGGVMYQFVGKEAPFLLLAALALLDGILQLLVLKIGVHPEDKKGTSLKDLLKDPYILVAAGSITFANMGVGMLEPTLPLWMWDTFDAPKWQQGVVFLPASIAYLIGTNMFGPLAYKMGRWLSAMLGMIIVGACMFAIPLAQNFTDLLTPNAGWGIAIGMVDSAMMPVMGYLVDLRHVAVYGSVYAIADVAFCVGFAIGPAVSGWIIMAVGFKWMMWLIAIVNILYAPLMLFLRKPPGKEEEQSLVMSQSKPVQRITYNSNKYEQFESDDDEPRPTAITSRPSIHDKEDQTIDTSTKKE